MTCLFCDVNEDEVLHRTENFYLKVGKAIITAGHIMIISKNHYLAMGEMDDNLVEEFLELKQLAIKEIEKKFAKPFLVECGNYGQSVFHAHIQIVPKSGNDYNNVDPFNELVLPKVKELNTKIIKLNNFQDLQKYYNKHKKYTYYEDAENGEFLIEITDDMANNKQVIDYREYFTEKGLKGVSGWKNMSKEDIEIDKVKIEKTINTLKF